VEPAVRKHGDTWAVAVTDRSGAETVVAERDDRAAATHVERRLRAFTRDRAATGFTITTPASPLAWVFAGLAVAISLGLTAHSLSGGARFRVEVDRQHDALRIVRTWFGLPRARLSARLADVADVELERGPGRRRPRVRALPRRAGWPPRPGPAGWLAPAPVGPDAARTRGPRAVVRGAAGDARAAGRGAAAAAGDQGERGPADAVGMDLLPGGRIETSLPAGDYTLRVWDAGAPGWSERTVRVRPGMTTLTSCSAP